MDETTQIKAVLKRFGCIRHPIVDELTVGLGVNSTKYIMTMVKPVIKEIKKRLGDLIYPRTPQKKGWTFPSKQFRPLTYWP